MDTFVGTRDHRLPALFHAPLGGGIARSEHRELCWQTVDSPVAHSSACHCVAGPNCGCRVIRILDHIEHTARRHNHNPAARPIGLRSHNPAAGIFLLVCRSASNKFSRMFRALFKVGAAVVLWPWLSATVLIGLILFFEGNCLFQSIVCPAAAHRCFLPVCCARFAGAGVPRKVASGNGITYCV